MLAALFPVIFALLVLGVLLWALSAFPWIDANVKQVIKILVIVVVAVWLLNALYGILLPASGPLFRLPRA